MHFLHRSFLLLGHVLQTYWFLEHQKSLLESESARIVDPHRASAEFQLVKKVWQLRCQLFDYGRVLEDLRSVFGQPIDARRSNWVNDLAHAPVEQMFDDSSDVFECQAVLHANLLETLHWIQEVDSMA